MTDGRLPNLGRKPIPADFDLAWLQAQARVDEIDAEHSRVGERQKALHERLSPLQQLRSEIQKWMRRSHIELPGGGPEPSPRIVLPTAQTTASDGGLGAIVGRMIVRDLKRRGVIIVFRREP